jgi:hypothetical protein
MSTAPLTIDRVPAPSRAEFERKYLKPSRPVVLQGAMDDWMALGSWTPESLIEKVGDNPVAVQSSPNGVFGLDEEKGGPRYEEKHMTFGEYARHVLSGQPSDTRLYLQRSSIPDLLPQLLEDFEIPRYVDPGRIYLMNLWFGPGGNVTRLHYDVPNNVLAQIAGTKRFVMFPPRDMSRLYPFRSKSYNMSQVDIDGPDLERFPRFRDARRVEVTLRPGEMLFIPSFWWHQVYSEETGLTVNFWWLPRLRQYFVPQFRDCAVDVFKETRRLLAGKLRARRAAAA